MESSALLLTVPEVADLTRISVAQLYLMLRRGELPCVKVGRVYRVPRAALERWIADQLEASADRSRAW